MSDNLKSWKLFKVFILFLTSFLLGIIFSFYIANNIKAPLLKNSISSFNVVESIWKEEGFRTDLDLSEFWKVYDIVKEDYYWTSEIEKENVINGIIKWFIDSLWDKHSVFMEPIEKEAFNNALWWDFEGIWAIVEKVNLWVKVEMLIKWSPAKEAWILAWDIIIEANWDKLQDLDLYDAVDKIKWPAWTKVLLNIFRNWERDLLDIEVTRKKIKIPSVESKVLEDENLWYISINIFWESTSRDFSSALDDLDKKGLSE